MAYPTATELKTFLLSAGLISDPTVPPDSYIDYQGAVDSAVLEWEQYSGWKPFLIDTNDVTRYFDPPNSRALRFGAGLSSLTSVTVNGTVLTVGTDFFLKEENAPTEGLPYTWLEFRYRQYGSPNMRYDLPKSVVIIGKWGRVATITADIKTAVLNGAAALVMNQCALRESGGGLSEWREGDVMQKYSAAESIRFEEAYRTKFMNTSRRYYRGGIG